MSPIFGEVRDVLLSTITFLETLAWLLDKTSRKGAKTQRKKKIKDEYIKDEYMVVAGKGSWSSQ
jgi:hypothetical protein